MNSKKDFNIGSSSIFLENDIQKRSAFLQDLLDCLRDIKNGDKTWKDLNILRQQYGFPEVNTDSLRRSFGALTLYDENGWVLKPLNNEDGSSYLGRETVETNYSTGVTTSDKVISLLPEEINNGSVLLKSHGFDPDFWSIVSAKNSKWEQGSKDGIRTLYSSKITVKPRVEQELTLEAIDDYFNGLSTKKIAGLSITPTQYDPNGEFLEVDITDLHVGLLSYGQETGEDYDVYIAKERLVSLISDVVERCQGRKFKRIVLALMGDIIHIDNYDNTTTKGTRQDVDTRPTKMFDEALDMLIECINTLGSIAPIEVVSVSGNHDQLSSYMLIRALEMCFLKDKNVKFYNSPSPRKCKKYGNVLIGWAHGDMKQDAVSEWASNEYSNEWGQTKYREIHLGHLHSVKTLQKIEDQKYGLITRYLPALCASSAWEDRSAFPKALRSLVCFVWNEDKGLREIWYNNV